MFKTRRVIPATAILAAGFLPLTALPAQAARSAPAAPAAPAAATAKPGDFNGDGYRDLAVGAPTMTVGTVSRAGAVTVAYGSKSGISTAKHQAISQASPGVPGARETEGEFGKAIASGDFDHDGYADLAIGSPGATVGAHKTAGTVTIVYGSADGLSDRAAEFSQGSDGVPGPAKNGTEFGHALAAGDVNGDGYADLAVTNQASDLKDQHAVVLYGGAKGVSGANATTLKQPPGDDFPPKQGDERGLNEYGTDVTVADANGDGKDDVFVSFIVKHANGELMQNYPGVSYYPGSGDGAKPDREKTFDDSGSALAGGDINGDGKADVVAGYGGNEFANSRVTVLAGSASGPKRTQTFDQDTEGVPGSSEIEDAFGESVALGDVNGDGKDDLAVGAPGEDTGAYGEGRVTLLRGSAGGVQYTGATTYDQDTKGVPGHGEYGDVFGHGVALIDSTNDKHAQMAVGSPGENGTGDVWNRDGDGSVTLFKGGASGPSLSGVQQFGATTLGGLTKKANFGNPIG